MYFIFKSCSLFPVLTTSFNTWHSFPLPMHAEPFRTGWHVRLGLNGRAGWGLTQNNISWVSTCTDAVYKLTLTIQGTQLLCCIRSEYSSFVTPKNDPDRWMNDCTVQRAPPKRKKHLPPRNMTQSHQSLRQLVEASLLQPWSHNSQPLGCLWRLLLRLSWTSMIWLTAWMVTTTFPKRTLMRMCSRPKLNRWS